MRFAGYLLGFSLLAFQVGAIAVARFVDSRYFCWAPYDVQTRYRLQVTVNDRPLPLNEIARRYRRGFNKEGFGFDNRSPAHVMDIIEQAEQRYHPADRVEVLMTYTVNGKEERTWHYRQP